MDALTSEMYPQKATYWSKTGSTWERYEIKNCRIAAVRGADKVVSPHANVIDSVRLYVPFGGILPSFSEGDRFVEGVNTDVEPPKPPIALVVTSVYPSHLGAEVDHYEIGGV